jgi:2-polyprenyl-3-methyl-5-hydroxy-6-metoxy-1,4-benzoquinol methylase
MEFTGERCILGKVDKRIEEDHVNRYLLVQKIIDKNDRVLDIACGEGYGASIMSAKTKDITGVDISVDAISYARSKYKNISNAFFVGDAKSYSNDNPYDKLVSFETIEHISDYLAVIKNYNYLLKKNGLLFISSPNRIITSPNAKNLLDKPKNKFHTQEFTIFELTNILESNGFEIINIYGQRREIKIKNSRLRSFYHRFFRLHERTSSVPKRVGVKNFLLHPRYFIVEAKKIREYAN